MKTTVWNPDASTDYLDDYVQDALTYPTNGIFSPYEILRVTAFALQKHAAAAIVKVDSYASDVTGEFPHTDNFMPAEPAKYFFAARDLVQLQARDFPACFVTFASIRSMRDSSMTGARGKKDRIDANIDIVVTPAVREKDPEIAEIKCLRLCAALEYVLINVFMAPHAKNPGLTPLDWYFLDVLRIRWIPGPTIAVEEKENVRIWSMIFPLRKRLTGT